jgi:hypothetical protein
MIEPEYPSWQLKVLCNVDSVQVAGAGEQLRLISNHPESTGLP